MGAAGSERPWRDLTYKTVPRWGSAGRQAWLRLKHRHATLRIDPSVLFGPGFTLHLPSAGRLEIGPGVVFRRGCVIEMDHGSRVTIGAGTVLTYGVVIQCTAEVTIGERCLFAAGASVVDSRHRFREGPVASTPLASEPVRIGDDVWVASKATVNADVGSGAAVAAGSVVTRPVPPRVLAAGAPAVVVEELAGAL